MKLRQALKIRDKIVDHNAVYQSITIERMRRRLRRTEYDDDFDIEFHRMMGRIRDACPTEFAAFQFDCGMKLIEGGLGELVRGINTTALKNNQSND